MALHWNEHFATGSKRLDRQIHLLLADLNHLGSLERSGDFVTALDSHLPSLIARFVAFFRDQEDLLRRIGKTPDTISRHIKQHRSFLDQVDAQRDRRQRQGDAETTAILSWYIESWLLNHLIRFDGGFHKLSPGELESGLWFEAKLCREVRIMNS